MAMLRAFATNEPEAVVRNPDDLAGELAGGGRLYRLGLSLASVAPLRAVAKWAADLVAEGGYWSEIARVKHYDEVLLGEAEGGVRQVVVLGAGLDSRAYRFAGRLAGVQFFEVDHPAMSGYKQERVAAVFGTLPKHVAYVGHDLVEDGLDEALAAAGFDPARATLVLWIGVSMYLPQETIDGVFGWVGKLAPSSSLGFDYFEQSFFDDEGRLSLTARSRVLFALSGERFVSGLADADLETRLARQGLTYRSRLTPREAQERYLRRADGSLAGPMFPHARYAHAGVV